MRPVKKEKVPVAARSYLVVVEYIDGASIRHANRIGIFEHLTVGELMPFVDNLEQDFKAKGLTYLAISNIIALEG